MALITETNVPHEDNVSYFGDGWNEAQLVYNFALPPLTLHTFLTGDATRLAALGGRPLDALAGDDLLQLPRLPRRHRPARRARHPAPRRRSTPWSAASRRAAAWSPTAATGDGASSPYELNVTWYSALNPEGAAEDLDLQVARFVASRSIALALAGVPGIYLPSLFGSKNDVEAVKAGEGARAINRDTIDLPALDELLADAATWVARVAQRFGHLIRTRIATPAFHPNAPQIVLEGNPSVFALLRIAADGDRVLAVTNVTAETQRLEVSCAALGVAGAWRDRLGGRVFLVDDDLLTLDLEPYGVLWLSPAD